MGMWSSKCVPWQAEQAPSWISPRLSSMPPVPVRTHIDESTMSAHRTQCALRHLTVDAMRERARARAPPRVAHASAHMHRLLQTPRRVSLQSCSCAVWSSRTGCVRSASCRGTLACTRMCESVCSRVSGDLAFCARARSGAGCNWGAGCHCACPCARAARLLDGPLWGAGQRTSPSGGTAAGWSAAQERIGA